MSQLSDPAMETAANSLSVRIRQDKAVFYNPKLCNEVLDNLNTMRIQGLFCDVVIHMGEDQNAIGCVSASPNVRAHACVLAATSQLFHDVLERETQQRNILLTAFDEVILNVCLDYMYGQEVAVPTSQIQDLSAAASTLQIKSLMLQCAVVETAIANATTTPLVQMDHLIVMKDDSGGSTQGQSHSDAIHGMDTLSPSSHNANSNLLPNANTSPSTPIQVAMHSPDTPMQRNVSDMDSSQNTVQPIQEVLASPETPMKRNDPDMESSQNVVSEHPIQEIQETPVQSNLLYMDVSKNFSHPDFAPLAPTPVMNSQGLNESITKAETQKAALKTKGNSVPIRNVPLIIRKAQTSKYPNTIEFPNPFDNTQAQQNDANIDTQKQKPSVATRKFNPLVSIQKPNSTSGTKPEPEWIYRQRVQPTKCDHCNRMFKGLSGLRQHKNRLAKNPNLRIPPTKEERKQKEIARHLRQRNKVYTCETCGVTVKGWHNLFKHRRVKHLKPYVCKYCDKVFAYPNQLRVHESRHTNDKPFLCAFCEYRSVTKKEVEHHEQVQHLDIRFNCPECSMVFKCDMYLQRHIRAVHVKGPMQCKYCDYSTTSNSHLKTHVMNKHFPDQRKQWVCQVCDKKFTMKSHLDRHLTSVHRALPTAKIKHTVNTRVQESRYQEHDEAELDPVIDSTTIPAIIKEKKDFELVSASPVSKQLGPGATAYLRTSNGTLVRVQHAPAQFKGAVLRGVKPNIAGVNTTHTKGDSTSRTSLQSQSVAQQSTSQLQSGVTSEIKMEQPLIYYEDDTYI